MIIIGASQGGLKAVQILLDGLPRDFPRPVVVVLHRHRESDDTLPVVLQKKSVLPVAEVLDKMPIQPGQVYVAPADYHLLVEPTHFSLSTDELVHHARPSLDVAFESAADAFGAGVIGVVLTGSSRDGARGAAAIQRRGGIVIVQDPTTAESAAMPAAAVAATRASHVLPLDQIAATLIQLAEAITTKKA